MPNMRDEWHAALAELREEICERFGRLKFNEEPCCIRKPVPDNKIEMLKDIAAQKWPSLNLEKVNKNIVGFIDICDIELGFGQE